MTTGFSSQTPGQQILIRNRYISQEFDRQVNVLRQHPTDWSTVELTLQTFHRLLQAMLDLWREGYGNESPKDMGW